MFRFFMPGTLYSSIIRVLETRTEDRGLLQDPTFVSGQPNPDYNNLWLVREEPPAAAKPQSSLGQT